MKKEKERVYPVYILWGLALIMVLACVSTIGWRHYHPTSPVETQKEIGVVHRVFQSSTDFSVRLTDGKIIAGYSCDNYKMKEDFFFAQPGDTIVYCGEKVLEVRFKD